MTDVTYRAKWLLPISRSPMENGWLRIVDGQVAELGQGAPGDANAVDLGDVALLPALVNSHTHLEFSYLTSPIGTPGMRLCDWIGQVVAARQQTNVDPLAAMLQGLQAIDRSGCALVADIATTPVTYPTEWNFPGRLISFAEALGLSTKRVLSKQDFARQHVEWIKDKAAGSGAAVAAGVSPHAPYSTPFDLVAWCVALAREQQIPLAMHVAESDEERQLIEQGTGPFLDQLVSIVPTAREHFPWGPTATSVLIKLLAAAPRSLLVHGNYLQDDEIELVAKHPSMSVVYCPRTHHFFGHPPHPVAKLLRAGVRVALGTDSLASNPDLSIWEEVRWLLCHRQDLQPNNVLKMATLAGAEALGEPRYGQLAPGCCGRCLQLDLRGLSLDEAMATGHPRWAGSESA